MMKQGDPKLTPISRQIVYLVISPHQAGSVVLVLNIKTGYISPQFHIFFDDDFKTTTARITNKLSENWDDTFKNYCEIPQEEFQFSIGKQWKPPNDRVEGDRKVNNNSPTDCSEVDRKVNNKSATDHLEVDRKENNNSPSEQKEGANSRSIEKYIYPQRYQVGAIS